MTKHILTKGGKSIELNALLIQPTRWCEKSCEGCYVHGHSADRDGPHLPWEEVHKLFNAFYKGEHWANQITISIDDLNKDPAKQRHMLLVADAILNELIKDTRLKEDRPEVHMTLHSVRTLGEYLLHGVVGWDKLDMLSFSTLALGEKGRLSFDYFKNKVPINYNKVVYSVPSNPEEEAKKLETLAKDLQHIYLVMFKRPVARWQGLDKQTQDEDRKKVESYKTYISLVLPLLSKETREKISLDQCYHDVIQFKSTGFGCSANISKFQVWPDGSTSGCPYKATDTDTVLHNDNKNSRNVEFVLRNIREGQKQYDFDTSCHLPRAFTV